jgi:glycosyltransferase involved in cell wall biosynthesis
MLLCRVHASVSSADRARTTGIKQDPEQIVGLQSYYQSIKELVPSQLEEPALATRVTVNNNPSVLHVLAPMREGGLERVVTMMSVGQRSNSVHVAAVVEPDTAERHPFIVQLEVLDVPVTRVVVGARNYLREYRSLSALVARLQPGVVHTHGYRADVIGGAVARSHRVLTVSTVHGFTGGGRSNRLYERIQLLALKRAGGVIAVSRPLVQRLEKGGVPRHKIHCIPNGFAPLVDTATRAAARQRLGLRADALVAGWVGRLSREKGADVMLNALARSDPRWQLSVIGEGDELVHLREQAAKLAISDRITWHGAITNAGSLLAAFDAFVLSSRTEGTPITLLEAMNAGTPVVATRVGGVPDVVSSSQAILVPAEQPGMIAQALSELEREPYAATARSLLARERLLQSFSAEKWLDAVDSAYEAARRSTDNRNRG